PDADAIEGVRRLLHDDGHEVRCHRPGEPDPDNLSSYHLAILDASGDPQVSLAWCRQLRARAVDVHLPVLVLLDDPTPAARLASFEAGADTSLLRPFAAEELRAQVRAFLRIGDMQERLAEKSAEVQRINKRLQQAYQQIDQELELARRLQVSFLPQRLPEVPPARFAVHYLLCGQVG